MIGGDVLSQLIFSGFLKTTYTLNYPENKAQVYL